MADDKETFGACEELQTNGGTGSHGHTDSVWSGYRATSKRVSTAFFQRESVAFVQKGRKAFFAQPHGGSRIEIGA
ncbi:MAG: hypothetical protein HOC74_42310 [Gemmatimonadetes bacterium]|jgi:hypothetical protein|nr:hypothetical protein [Gemmatimonadota bacterium]